MTDDKAAGKLRLATATEAEETLSVGLRYDGKQRVHHADTMMAELTAEHLVQHLERDGFVLLKRAPAAAPTSSCHPHPHKR